MKLLKAVGIAAGAVTAVAVTAGAVAFAKERIDEIGKPVEEKGTYERFVKRPLDCTLATGATICLSPVLAATALLVRNKLGSPVLFTQERPGKDEKIFKLYKFRTMTDERDENGELMPDDVRLTGIGKTLRSTSLDELPELINIVKGDMAVIGPRPQLVRDMVFMTDRQRRRHTVRPGLSGLAQVNGRNVITWEDKLEWDLKYIDDITFTGDVGLIGRTFGKVFKRADINREGTQSDMDFGDYLLEKGAVTKEEYDRKQEEAKKILRG